MSYYSRSEMGQASPGVEQPAPAIPDRVALTNERLYPRSRLLSLAKQHLIATNLKSAQIVQALLKKREEGDSRQKRRVSRVASRIRETTRSISTAVVGTAQSPLSPAGQGRIIHFHPASPTTTTGKDTDKAVLPPPIKTAEVGDSRGRSPVRPHPLQYTDRYSVRLRGLTPSPTRFKSEASGRAATSSKQWRATKRPATPPPARRGHPRAPTPSRSIVLVTPRHIDQDVLPLEGCGWMDYDSPFTRGFSFESPSGFGRESPMIST